jgi:DNA polymerase (family 10)
MLRLKRIFKKGKRVTTRQGKIVVNLANKMVSNLRPHCKRIKIVGSIRRKEKNPVDIDIVLIPKKEENKRKIEEILSRKGKFLEGGEQRANFRIEGVKVELYYTLPEEWGAAMLSDTGPFGASIGLRIIAKSKGLRLNQHGLFKNERRIAGKTEKEIYSALGKEWKKPEDR